MRLAFVCALALAASACDTSDPFGLYPEPATEIVAPLEYTGRIVDEAQLLSALEEDRITGVLESLERDTLAQLVVVTTPSLDGFSIEDYSIALGRGWGIGHWKRHDGLLLVVAPNEQKMRIEVGYGLEGTVDDVFAADVIEGMKPFFQRADFEGGVSYGVSRLSGRVRKSRGRKAA